MLNYSKYVYIKKLLLIFICFIPYCENYVKKCISYKSVKHPFKPLVRKIYSLNQPNPRFKKFAFVLKATEELEDYKYFTDDEYIPPLPPVETWEDLIIKEEIRNKNEDEKRDIDDYKLTHESREKVLDIMRQTRLINHCNYEIQKNKQKNILYFVTPKMGPYCKLMENDKEKMESLISKVKEKFGRKVKIANLKLDVKMPLFEIFLQANIHTQIKIFYARGRTLQYRLPPQFWTRCKILKENKILQEKYGGECAPGLFPQYDEYQMMQIMTECIYNDKYNYYVYDVNLEWENLCALTPENREFRKLVHQNVHVPTRLAVIKAFEEGKKYMTYFHRLMNFMYINYAYFGIASSFYFIFSSSHHS